VPTLVLVREDWPAGTIEESEWTANQIPGAHLRRLHGDEDDPYLGDVSEVAAEVGRFISSIHEEQAVFDRVLATVLFTDIVGSTDRASATGDRGWKDLVEQHHARTRALINRFRGNEVDTAGDGFFATFDGPGRAVHCAQAIIRSVASIGIQVRAGIHTGEVETIDRKAGGIAVMIGARIGALAGPSEIFASSTVKDLTSGSGLTFQDAGDHALKGVPDRWHLYRVVAS
jgi:class 3 adenylate cyclase